MHERHDALIGDDYQILPFRDLPRPYRLAVAHYMAVNGDTWTDAAPDRAEDLEASLPGFDEHYGDVLFGIASIPADAAKASVMSDPELADSWNGDWDAYHAWYTSRGDTPDYGTEDRWPCVMAGAEWETFQDGWHRFHSYCRAGHADIPVVFYPMQRHLDARMAAPAPR